MEPASVSLTARVTDSMTSIVCQHKISHNDWNHRVSSFYCFTVSINYAECFHINIT